MKKQCQCGNNTLDNADICAECYWKYLFKQQLLQEEINAEENKQLQIIEDNRRWEEENKQ